MSPRAGIAAFAMLVGLTGSVAEILYKKLNIEHKRSRVAVYWLFWLLVVSSFVIESKYVVATMFMMMAFIPFFTGGIHPKIPASSCDSVSRKRARYLIAGMWLLIGLEAVLVMVAF